MIITAQAVALITEIVRQMLTEISTGQTVEVTLTTDEGSKKAMLVFPSAVSVH